MQKLHLFGIPGLLVAGLLTGCLGDPATPLEVTGANSLAAVTDAPTSTCATGGKVVSVGVDDNQDGTLQDTEIDASTPVCNGAVGVTGATGATGATGEQGIPGEIGNVGPQGQTGAQGAQGEIGPMGPRGDQGNQGAIGEQGDVGLPGSVGEPGKNGGTAAFRQDQIPAGPECVDGGRSLAYGLDRDGNGFLDHMEETGRVLLCDSLPITNGRFEVGDFRAWSKVVPLPDDTAVYSDPLELNFVAGSGQFFQNGDVVIDRNGQQRTLNLSQPVVFPMVEGGRLAAFYTSSDMSKNFVNTLQQTVVVPAGATKLLLEAGTLRQMGFVQVGLFDFVHMRGNVTGAELNEGGSRTTVELDVSQFRGQQMTLAVLIGAFFYPGQTGTDFSFIDNIRFE